MYSWWFCEQNNSYPGLIWWDWFGRKPMDVWNRPTQLPRIKWLEPRNVFYNVVMDPLKGLLDALVSLRSILESVFSRVLEIHICRKYTESTRQAYQKKNSFQLMREFVTKWKNQNRESLKSWDLDADCPEWIAWNWIISNFSSSWSMIKTMMVIDLMIMKKVISGN